MAASDSAASVIETALYICQTAPYPCLFLRGITLSHWGISLVVEGAVAMRTGGREYTAIPGDVMIHPPGIAFDETNPCAGLHLWLACAAKVHDPHPENLFDRYPLPPVVTLGRTRLAAYRETFRRLQDAHDGGATSTNRLHCMAHLTELFALLLEAWEDAGSSPRPPELVSPTGRFASVITYLRSHIAEPVSRADLAAIACLHPTAFDRAFVRATGQTPLRLLSEMRLSEARQRLESSDDTLETIAKATGLTDAAHLSRLFRARFGVAPGKWRQSVLRTKTGYLSPLPAK